MHICEVGEKMGYDLRDRRCASACSGGEAVPPGSQGRDRERMHIICTDNYGLTEVMGPGVSGRVPC